MISSGPLMPALKRNVFAGVVSSICASGLFLASASLAQPSSGAAGEAPSYAPGRPIMAIVALKEQKITVYTANGPILRASVSSGRKGYETPAGIYSVLQKEAEHYLNLYEDGYMPFMQRITWSGIALHGGPLPGYAASHGCVRMPVDFAERLFHLTKVGLRVIVAPGDPVGIEINHPVLARLNPAQVNASGTESAQATPF